MSLSRRRFVQLAGAGTGLLMQSQLLNAQRAAVTGAAPDKAASVPSKVALVHGDDRRKNVHHALETIDDQIKAGLQHKKYVLIKPNFVSTTNQLAATHVDAVNGILDYLEPRYHGPIVIAESSIDDTLDGFENFKYNQMVAERKAQKIKLVDLNREGKYETIELMDADLHAQTIRLAAMLLDPNAYVISSAMLKAHNSVVATMTVKNMVLGSPIRSAPGEAVWSDKSKFHVGVRQMHYNMLVTAERLHPNWGVGVIDGFQGMEGDGPLSGTPVDSRIAIASTDFIAADRVGVEAMGIDPSWLGYLNYCAQAGLGQFDLSKIEVLGPPIASVQKKYQLSPHLDRQLKWMGPLKELPARFGDLLYPNNAPDKANA